MLLVCACCVIFVSFVCWVFLVLFFLSSRRLHTRCALVTGVQTCALPIFGSGTDTSRRLDRDFVRRMSADRQRVDFRGHQLTQRLVHGAMSRQDRKSVVWGKSVSVRVDLGGRRIINKKKSAYAKTLHTTGPTMQSTQKALQNTPLMK